jgi:hypothetical protein
LAVEDGAGTLDDIDFLKFVGVDLAFYLAALPAGIVAEEAIGGFIEAADIEPVETGFGAVSFNTVARGEGEGLIESLDVALFQLIERDDGNGLGRFDEGRIGFSGGGRGIGDKTGGAR